MQICSLHTPQLEKNLPKIESIGNVWRVGVDLTIYGSQFKLALGFVYLATLLELR